MLRGRAIGVTARPRTLRVTAGCPCCSAGRTAGLHWAPRPCTSSWSPRCTHPSCRQVPASRSRGPASRPEVPIVAVVRAAGLAEAALEVPACAVTSGPLRPRRAQTPRCRQRPRLHPGPAERETTGRSVRQWPSPGLRVRRAARARQERRRGGTVRPRHRARLLAASVASAARRAGPCTCGLRGRRVAWFRTRQRGARLGWMIGLGQRASVE